MPNEQFPPDFEEKDFDLCKADLDSLQNKLSFTQNLPSKQKIRYYRIGKNSLAFAEKAIHFYRKFPKLHCNYVVLEKWEKNLAVYIRLLKLQKMLENLESGVADMLNALEKENSKAALTYYSFLKIVPIHKVPEVEEMREELASFFKRQPRKPKKTKAVANMETGTAKPEDEEAKE